MGWAPATAWDTPIPQIQAALTARIEWTKMTNPFGSPEPEKAKTPEKAKSNTAKNFLAFIESQPGTKTYGRK